MSLPSPLLSRKYLLTLLCLGIFVVVVGRVVRVYLAERAADASEGESQITGLERSIRLAPDDAEFHHLLGLRLSTSGQDHDGAIAHLREAVALNPNRGYYWFDLASAYQVTGNVEKEIEAVQSALNAEPGNPEIKAEAGQFFLSAGATDRAFPLFKQALEQNPEAVDAILRTCWQQTPDAKLILARAIPANPSLQLAFLRMLVEQGDATEANDVWQAIVTAQKSFPPQLSFFYFDYLLQEHDVAGFQRDWQALAALAPEMQPYLPNDNLIVNGGFEQPILNSGLDWRHQTADHIAVHVDDKVAHSGRHSLSLSYDGNPAYDSGWTQFVPVQADANYEFSAWIRSQDVITSSGPRIALVDGFSGDDLLLTDDVLDTHPWQELKGTLRVPAATKLVALKIVRAPANTRIRGQIWIDDLRLVKSEAKREANQ